MSVTSPLLTTKLYLPAVRPDLVRRPRLLRRLSEGISRPLTLISAPAGFGKTTLISSWIYDLRFPHRAIVTDDLDSSTAMEPVVASGADGVEPLGGGPAEASTPSPAVSRNEIVNRVAWLALDDDDNDPARFLTYLIAAVATLKPDFGQSSLDLLKSPQPAPAKLILTNFINEVNQFSAPFVLALDDYHVISAPAIHEAVTFLLDHLPPPMRLIITTRIDPPLPLARWRVRQQLVEIRADELRFTLAETAAFLNQVMGLNLSAANIVMLETRIEGWPAGLQMAALSMQGRGDITRFLSSFTGSHRYILDYLIDEVLQQQPPDIQEFLLKTSMLSRLAGPLCNAVLGRDNSQVMLEQLEQANLFVLPLDNERRWYRYHHLFAEALRHRLQHLHPEQEPVLHQRASIWYEQHRLIAEAIHHTLNEPDFERAAHLIEQAGQELLLRSETVTLLKWLNALPETIIQTRPRLCLFHAWTLLLNNQVAEAEQRLQTAAELEAEPALLAQVAAIRTLIALFRGDRRQANELTRQAQALLPTGDPFLRGVTLLNLGLANVMSGKVEAAQQAFAEVAELSQKSGNVMITVTIQCQMAEARIAQGRLHQALTTYQQALALATTPEGLQLPGAGQAHMGLAAIMVEWNNLEAAAGHLAEGFRLNRELGEIGAFDAYIIQANLKQAQSDAAGALAAIEQAGQIIQKFSGWVYRSVAAHRARLWLKQANLAAAAGWAADLLNQAAAAPDDDPEEAYFLYEFEQLTLARVLIAQASVALPTDPARAALQLLERLYLRAVKQGRGKSVIEILLLQALAHQAGGNNARAISLLRQALTLAEPEGFVRLFVDEGLPLAGLLYKLNASPEHTGLEAYIHKLLAACPNLPSPVSDPSSIKAGDGVEASAGPPPKGSTPDAPTESIVNPKSKIQNLIDPLTERELEILHLIAAGQSNKEIARTLVIAVGTVKKHLNSIYGKLDVHSRTQAIVQAKALNLLP